MAVRTPLKIPPLTVPAMVVGANVAGNKEVTERGQTFLVTVVNLLASSFKLFETKESLPWDDCFWPGLDTANAPENAWQLINYVGKDREHQKDWGDFSRVDLDFDGIADPAKRINDALTTPAGSVSYESLWSDEVKPNLSCIKQYGKILTGNSGRDNLYSDERCFAFLAGLVEIRRRWELGLKAIGIDAADLNAAGAADRFKETFNSWKLQEAGGVNIQVLTSFLDLRDDVAGKYDALSHNDWLTGTVLPAAKRYCRRLIGQVKMPPFPEGELSAMAKMVGDNGRLLLPPKGEKESKEDYQARLSKTYDQAEQRLGALRKYLDSCKNEFGEINERLGLVSGKLRALEGEFAKLAGDYAARIPEAVSSRTDFSELLALLRLAREKYTLISEAVSDPGAALDELFAELTGPLSAEPLSKEMKTAVSSCFKEASNKPIGQVIGTIGANSLFRVMNKINQKNFEIKKEEEREDKIKEVRTEEKHRSRIMAQIKKEAEAAEKARPNKKGK